MIDSIDKQVHLEQFLSPLRGESTSYCRYAGRFIKVYYHRLSYFLSHLFHFKVKWHNNNYVARKVSLSSARNRFTQALEIKLKNRRVKWLKVDSLLRKIHSNPLTEGLYQEAEKEFKKIGHQTISIRLIEQKQAYQKARFDGFCSYDKGEILLRLELSKKQALSILIFELFNATTTQQFKQTNSILSQESLNEGIAEKYATLNEKIEFENCLKHHNMITKLVKEYGWDSSLDRYANTKTFEEFLKVTKTDDHFQYYVNGATTYLNEERKYREELKRNKDSLNKMVSELDQQIKQDLLLVNEELSKLKTQPDKKQEIEELESCINCIKENI